MIDDIYVFDDIIEKPYQELIKETLIGEMDPQQLIILMKIFHGIIPQMLLTTHMRALFKEDGGLVIIMFVQKKE